MLKRNRIILTKAAGLLLLAGATSAVFASVPRSNQVTNDVAIYQNLHEIKITQTKHIDFDNDIHNLSAREKSHRSALPARISTPMERVNQTPYRPGSYRKR